MPYEIRPLTESDLRSYRALRLQALTECPSAFGATPSTEQALEDAQILHRFGGGPGQIMWGGFDEDDKLCATLGMYRDTGEKTAHKGHLFAMYVSLQARSQGLARRLLEVAIAHASALQLRQLMLGCNTTNRNALRLYEQAGFQTYGREPAALYVNGEFFDEVLMVRPLASSQPHPVSSKA